VSLWETGVTHKLCVADKQVTHRSLVWNIATDLCRYTSVCIIQPTVQSNMRIYVFVVLFNDAVNITDYVHRIER
jgi:hypothetical protein